VRIDVNTTNKCYNITPQRKNANFFNDFSRLYFILSTIKMIAYKLQKEILNFFSTESAKNLKLYYDDIL